MVPSSAFICLCAGSSQRLKIKMARRVLITGASGLLGRALYREFRLSGDWEVLGLAFSRAVGELKPVDLKDRDAVTKVVTEFKVGGTKFYSRTCLLSFRLN